MPAVATAAPDGQRGGRHGFLAGAGRSRGHPYSARSDPRRTVRYRGRSAHHARRRSRRLFSAGPDFEIPDVAAQAISRHNPRTMGENKIGRRAHTALVVGLVASAVAAAAPGTDAGLESLTHRDAAGRLQIDVHLDCALAAPVTALTAAGLAVASSVKAGTLCVVEGWAPSTALTQIQAVPGITR